MDDFPANSLKAKAPTPEPKKLERVTSGPVRRRKGLGRKFKETFIGGSAKTAGEYMAKEVVIPAVRDTLHDALQGGLEKFIYGESKGGRRPSAPPTSGYANLGQVDYTPRGMSSRKPPTQTLSRQSRSRQDFGEIVIESRRDAEEVVEQMFNVLGRYGQVAVADLYDLCGIEPGHTDYKWGWTDLQGAQPRPIRGGGGYVLALPKPQTLD